MTSPTPSPRQRLGLALIAGGILLSPVAAWTTIDSAGSAALGVGIILLLAIGGSLVVPAGRPDPPWLRWAWIAALAAMGGLLGFAIGAGDRADALTSAPNPVGAELEEPR